MRSTDSLSKQNLLIGLFMCCLSLMYCHVAYGQTDKGPTNLDGFIEWLGGETWLIENTQEDTVILLPPELLDHPLCRSRAIVVPQENRDFLLENRHILVRDGVEHYYSLQRMDGECPSKIEDYTFVNHSMDEGYLLSLLKFLYESDQLHQEFYDTGPLSLDKVVAVWVDEFGHFLEITIQKSIYWIPTKICG